MAGRIPQHFIDELVSRVDIVDVIDQFVPLKKAGREFAACCPFHDEKTPSFTVSPSKQFYHCFGCGAHGTVLGFLMDYDHLDFVEAVEHLAAREGLEVPREGGGREQEGPREDRQPLFELLSEADRFYRDQIRHHQTAKRAVEYLKNRGLSGEVARDYAIGYAPPGWDNLLKTLGASDERVRQMVQVGLLIEKDNSGHYDRFRDRIMFPIRDQRGRVIGFGGRVLGDEKPKYLNSPETPLFHKGNELYGLWEARQALRKIPRMVVVEGYMDVVALAQFGIRYAVATLGTSVTAEHLKRLFRLCSEVVFCFDGDRAGREAAWRGLENALPLMRDGRQVRFMFLPEGDDPDTLVRRVGAAGFEESMAGAVPLSGFLYEQLEAQTDMASLDGRARLVELARPLLSKLPAGAFRQLMVDQLALRSGMDSARLQHLIEPSDNRTAPPPPAAPAAPPAKRRQDRRLSTPSPVRRAVHMLLQSPELATLVQERGELEHYRAPGMELLLAMVDLLHRSPHLKSGSLLEHWRGSAEGKHLLRLAEQELILARSEELKEEFEATLGLLRRRSEQTRREARVKELQQRFRQLTADEKTELKRLLTEADKPV